MARNSEILELVSNILDKLIISQQAGSEAMSNLKFSIESLNDNMKDLHHYLTVEMKGDMSSSLFDESSKIQDILSKNQQAVERLLMFVENMEKNQENQISSDKEDSIRQNKDAEKQFEKLNSEIARLSSSVRTLNLFLRKPWRWVMIIAGVVIAVAGALGALAQLLYSSGGTHGQN